MPTTTAPAPAGLEAALAAALSTITANVERFRDWYPDDTTTEGTYRPRAARDGFAVGANQGWTTGFWPGMLWVAHDLTGRGELREAGERYVADFARRVEQAEDLQTHDLGFLYTLSCVAPWRLTGDTTARDAALAAADHLMARRLEPAGIIQAWGDLSDPVQRGRTIIDSLMNMPLLYWAGEVTGDARYAEAALRHAHQLRDNVIRDDDTTFHTFYWDVETGRPLRGATAQGHADDSCWARGQAWGIYGFALNHRYTGDASLLGAAVRCADYFVDHLPQDRVAYWDLVFGDGSGVERDTSAAAIAACGLDELSRQVDDPARRARYAEESRAIVASLARSYSTAGDPDADALLLHGVYDMPKHVGVDEASLYGDYFYVEALARLARPGWHGYW